jgi:integrase
MTKFNAENERIKWQYLEWEKEARGKAESTVNNIRDSLYLFEEHIGFKSFKKITNQDMISFKKQLMQKKNRATGEPVSKTYLLHVSKNLMNFFIWLCCQNSYKRKLSTIDIKFLSLSGKDTQIARSQPSKRFPSIEQIERVVRNMPATTEIQKRDRALMAFLALTGCRVAALASLKLKHVFVEDQRIEQHPQEVKTKYSKKIITYFFPVGDYLTNVFIEWVDFLQKEKLFDLNAPLFPNTKLSLNAHDQFRRDELDTTAWKSTTSIRTIVKDAFKSAGFDYYNPHSFRHTIGHLSYRYCKTPEELKAWIQNIGHNSALTTLMSYGSIDEHNQGTIIKRLNIKNKDSSESLSENEVKQLKNLLLKTADPN